jgi:hypothetical protein
MPYAFTIIRRIPIEPYELTERWGCKPNWSILNYLGFEYYHATFTENGVAIWYRRPNEVESCLET